MNRHPPKLRRIHPALAAVLTITLTSGLGNSVQAATDEALLFDGFEGCGPITALIGPAGGELRRCGAELRVPPNAVSAPVLFGIERLAEPPAAPFDMALAGAAFRFTPDDRSFDADISIRVPRHQSQRGGLAWQPPGMNEMILIEACGQSASGLQQFVGGLGTFAASHYLGNIPDSTQGLGDGELIATTQGVTFAHDLDDPGNNWAVYHDLPDGARQVLVSAMKELDDGIEYVRLDFWVDAATGAGSLQQISVLGSHSGSFIDGLLGDAQITFGDLADGRIRGEITANLASGPNSVPFQAAFDIGVERYYFPPSLSCPGGGMPPG